MNFIFIICFLVILAKLAYDDYRARILRDLDLALLWAALGIPGVISHNFGMGALGYMIAGFGFSFVYAILYSVPILIWKKPLARLGDVILFPPIMGFCGMLFGLGGVYLAFFALGLALIISFKKSLPLASWLFLFVLGLFIYVSSGGPLLPV